MQPPVNNELMPTTSRRGSAVSTNVIMPAPAVQAPSVPGTSTDHDYEPVSDFRSYDNVPVTYGYQDPVTTN